MKQLLVPGVLLTIVASMLLPLPPLVLDFLIVANLVLAFILLASTVYIADPMRLSSLPTILLLTTLYRLALNISTSRQILAHGEAGDVIEAFGSIVIQGNVLVGLVVFLIVSIVQFIVIAKGAERVAEVTARFTLDALPGKQMSIDADVRAGLLDVSNAQLKRQELQIESRFYGALDGAMKFIKGDALAGLVIVFLNLIAGFGIGIAMQNMGVKQAITHYSVLSVGDALVAQLPALLNALAAGVVVTRVTRGDGSSLASELPGQLGQLRVVKFLAAGLSALCGILPGMPVAPFFIFAAILFVIACVHRPHEDEVDTKEQRFVPKAVPLLGIDISNSLSKALNGHGPDLMKALDGAREQFYEETGILAPLPEARKVEGLSEGAILRLRGIEVARIEVIENPKDMIEGIAKRVLESLRRFKVDLVDDRMTRALLDLFERETPELAGAVIPAVVSVTQVSMVLRELIREEANIKNFDVIVQTLAEQGPKARNERALLEEVRTALGRSICANFTRGLDELHCYELAPTFDVAFVAAEKEGKIIDPLLIGRLIEEIRVCQPAKVGPIVVSKAGRAYLRDCLRARLISAPLLAYEEITENIKLVSRGRLGAALAEEAHESVVQALAA